MYLYNKLIFGDVLSIQVYKFKVRDIYVRIMYYVYTAIE